MTTPTLRMQVSTVRANATAVAASDHMSEDVRRLGQCMAMTCDVVAALLDRLEAIENPPAPADDDVPADAVLVLPARTREVTP